MSESLAPPADANEVDGLLESLVRQFASPYDFLRELVQNAMDAGSARVQVQLLVHREPEQTEGHADLDEVVFELCVVDEGEGMDEAIVDERLTRLFATDKRDDRTMAGGFGIGFVSVFAWEPHAVLVQTGRHGETWEVHFDQRRRFDKHRVDAPFEGTTVRLFRPGHPDERETIAGACFDALWRWCRFCPIELTFEDVEGGRGPEPIHEDATAVELAASARWTDGSTRIEAGFGVPARAVLSRRGLVLSEGPPASLLPAWPPTTFEHLRLSIDSPRLRTTLARDRVERDDGWTAVTKQAAEALGSLRRALVDRCTALVGEGGPWTELRQRELSYLLAHVRLELPAIAGLEQAPLLRLVTHKAISLAVLRERARLGVVALAPTDGHDLEAVTASTRAGVPVVFAGAPHDPGVEALLAHAELGHARLDALAVRIVPHDRTDPLLERVTGLLAGARFGQPRLTYATIRGTGDDRPWWAVQIDVAIGLVATRPVAVDPPIIVVDPEHPVVAAARSLPDPYVAGLGLGLGIVGTARWGPGRPITPEQLADALEESG